MTIRRRSFDVYIDVDVDDELPRGLLPAEAAAKLKQFLLDTHGNSDTETVEIRVTAYDRYLD